MSDVTNTFDEFDFRPGGDWKFTMHGPDGKNYRNESVFQEIDPPHKILIHHISEPKFHLAVTLAPSSAGTLVHWLQEFENPEFARLMEHILRPANDQNLDRLSAEVLRMPNR